MEDEEIIDLFFRRSEQAIGELEAKYGGLCHSLSYNILGNWEDAQECVNDAYLGTWNAIPPEHPDPLAAFVCRIVRNLSLKRYNFNTAVKRNTTFDIAISEVENCIPAADDTESRWNAKELAREIESFLDTQSRENRVIFMRRYWFADTYAQIGELVGISEKNVSVRLVRLRKQLRAFLSEKGVLV